MLIFASPLRKSDHRSASACSVVASRPAPVPMNENEAQLFASCARSSRYIDARRRRGHAVVIGKGGERGEAELCARRGEANAKQFIGKVLAAVCHPSQPEHP